MPVKRSLLFECNGTWDNLTLLLDGKDVDASRLYVKVTTERYVRNDKIANRTADATLTSLAWRNDEPVYGADVLSLFPGVVDCTFPRGKMTIQHDGKTLADGALDPNGLRIEWDGLDVTEFVNEVVIDVDSPKDDITAYLTLFHGHPIPVFGKDRIEKINLFE